MKSFTNTKRQWKTIFAFIYQRFSYSPDDSIGCVPFLRGSGRATFIIIPATIKLIIMHIPIPPQKYFDFNSRFILGALCPTLVLRLSKEIKSTSGMILLTFKL